MKKRILSIVLCLVMVFSLLPFTASAAGSATMIDEKNFPDPVFREYVRKVAGSSVLTDTIVRQIEALDVSKDNIKKVLGDRDPITSLKGIRYLKYVRDLNCRYQKLTTLDLELNMRVERLDCYGNQLTDLWLRPTGTSLKYLDCGVNQLNALDLSSNVALECLSVSENPIAELNLHPLSNLKTLYCQKMQLKKLDVDRCPKLQLLHCYDNQIETLDLRSNKKLQALKCQNNRLSWLDLSSNTELDPAKVDCSGNVYDIKVDKNLQYRVYPDLPCYGATEGTYFTAARASGWTGGTVSKVDGWDVLTLDNRDVKEVTYKYDTGNARIGKVAFTLKTEVPAKYITISFDPNGGTGTMKPMRVKAGVGYTLPECTFTPPEGKEFAGWLAVNGNVYPAGHDVFSTYDQSLKATWKDKEAAEITISFDPNGGTGTMQPMKVKSGEKFELPKCTFTPPEGKEFAGWLAANGTVYPAGDNVVSTTDSVLKATWKDKEAAEITITFEPNGGTGTMQPMKVKSGESFTLPECTFTPPEGKEFAGWLASTGKIFPAGTPSYYYHDDTLKATWKDTAEVDVTQMFTDVTKNWAYPGIQYCVTHQLMSGVGGNLFAPKMTTTRAQIVQILYNLEGEPKVSGTTPFTDLTQNWYKDAVLWAYQTGVVSGTSATTFAPDLPVTREQIAVILMEYMTRVLKLERTWTPADLSVFPDAGSVSGWAKDALADAVALGLISGASNGGQTYLEPQGSATREQVATILMEFCKNVKK